MVKMRRLDDRASPLIDLFDGKEQKNVPFSRTHRGNPPLFFSSRRHYLLALSSPLWLVPINRKRSFSTTKSRWISVYFGLFFLNLSLRIWSSVERELIGKLGFKTRAMALFENEQKTKLLLSSSSSDQYWCKRVMNHHSFFLVTKRKEDSSDHHRNGAKQRTSWAKADSRQSQSVVRWRWKAFVCSLARTRECKTSTMSPVDRLVVASVFSGAKD